MIVLELTEIVQDAREGEEGEDDVRQVTPAAYALVTIVDPAARIRSFTPRKGGRPGTRIAFLNGAGLIVKEEYSEVARLLRALPNQQG